ncbi:MAG: hypothetical protein NC541_06585 [bacterium]|nr:hypothetical protein [bacterium]
MKKKVLALLLATAMTLAATGCGDSPEPGSTPESQESGDSSAPTEESPEASSPETPAEPEYDFGGRTFRIGSYHDMSPDPEGSDLDQAYAERIEYVEQNYNCNIEFVVVGGGNDEIINNYVTSVLSGDPCCDAGYILSYRLLPALIEGGIAQPISDLGVVDFSAPWYDPAGIEAATYKGKQYGLAKRGAGVQYGIFWNKTLFDRYNLPDLYELYEKGEWTWDKFREIALAGNQDTDGDGEYDIWGFNQRENLIWSFMSSNGADAVKKTADGVELALDTPEAKEALEFYADFMQNVPHMKGWQGDWQSQIWSFRDGTSCMCYEAWWIANSYLNADPANDREGMQDDWGFVPFPMGPSGTEYVSYGKESDPWFILNGVEKPEEVAQVIDLIFQYEETEEDWDEAIMAQFEKNAEDSTAVEICLGLSTKNKISPLMGFTNLNNMLNSMMDSLGNGETTPDTALEANRAALEAAIEDIKTHDYGADMQQQMEDFLNPEEEEQPAE